MATQKRIASWKRYDEKRKGSPERLAKERARSQLRRLDYEQPGWCCFCGKPKKTVWYHLNYRNPPAVVALCYKCHRAEHPRKMPNGQIK